jgi:hypothetical protein
VTGDESGPASRWPAHRPLPVATSQVLSPLNPSRDSTWKVQTDWWPKTRRCRPRPHATGTGAWRHVRIARHGTILDTDRPSKFNRESQCLFHWRLFAKKRNYKLNLKKSNFGGF